MAKCKEKKRQPQVPIDTVIDDLDHAENLTPSEVVMLLNMVSKEDWRGLRKKWQELK